MTFAWTIMAENGPECILATDTEEVKHLFIISTIKSFIRAGNVYAAEWTIRLLAFAIVRRKMQHFDGLEIKR